MAIWISVKSPAHFQMIGNVMAHLHIVGNMIVKFSILIFLSWAFVPTKKKKLIRGGHFEFQQNIKKTTCTSLYRRKCDCTIWIISLSFVPTKKCCIFPLAAILNFGGIFKKSLAHPHVCWECDVKISKKHQTIFLVFASTKKLKLICGGHFEYQYNLEKVTCTSPYRGECDNTIWKNSYFKS